MNAFDLNLFSLVDDEERLWTNEHIDSVALKHFPNIDRETALKRPILYSNWLSKDYVPVDQEELREYVKARLKVHASRFTVWCMRIVVKGILSSVHGIPLFEECEQHLQALPTYKCSVYKSSEFC